MILDVNRQMPLAAPERNSFWHGPARERAVPFEPKVVVEAPRRMALDDESRGSPCLSPTTERLGRLPRVALPLIIVGGHYLWIVAWNATLSSPNGRRIKELPAQTVFEARG
jgi:hypothetical protein